MATATPTPTDAIEVELYKPDESGAKYEAHVQALIAKDAERTDAQIREGLHASVKVTFPKVENGKNAVERHKRWFRESAAAHDLSAKVEQEIDNGDGTVTVRYITVPKITRPRKPAAPASDADVPESAADAA
jgi:hypothetical protein